MNTCRFVLAVALAGVVAAACSKSEAPSSSTKTTGASGVAATGAGSIDAAQAKTIYQERCSACHGVNGRGDGPGAAALNPKPRNYTDKTWQAAVSDEQIKKTVIYGGAAVGKSPIMPASPDLEQKPDVLNGLVGIVRQFGN